MRASKVTQYGVPMADGGRACEFKIGDVRVFLTGPNSDDTRYVAESIAYEWNAGEDPEGAVFTSDFAGVSSLCERLMRGPVVHGSFSVGAWTPAVDDGFSWAVLDKGGSPLLLAHDSFAVAVYFCRLQEGSASEADGAGGPYRLLTDAVSAEREREDRAIGGVW